MIKFKCEFCDQRLGVPDDFVGKRVRCTKCRAVNIVPSAEERAARDAAAQADATKAPAPGEPPAALQKVALYSSLLDLSSGSGLLETQGGDSTADAAVFGMPKAVPAFDASPPPMPGNAPVSAEEAKAGTAFGVKLEEDLSFDEAPPPKGKDAGKDGGKDGADKKAAGSKGKGEGEAEEDFGLGLLENDPTDSTTGSRVDLDGLGF